MTGNTSTSWHDRLNKARDRLRARDLRGLRKDVAEFVAWELSKSQRGLPPPAPIPAPASRAAEAAAPSPTTASHVRSRGVSESDYWDQSDKELARRVGWGSAADFGGWALEKMVGRPAQIMDVVLDLIPYPRRRPKYGLVLGCGDMVGEHWMFLDPRLPFDEVDAYDVSPASIEKARALTEGKGLRVNYVVGDVNKVDLPANRYSLVVVSQSYHHFTDVDGIAKQINRSLAPEGVFYTMDYVGPRRLQYSPRQLYYAQHFLNLLPPEKRLQLDGTVREVVAAAPVDILSPDEAVRSDLILAALDKRLSVRWQYNFAGLLYPLLDGIAMNFTADERDQALLKFLFQIDAALCTSQQIEPNFTFTFAKKKA